MRADAKLTGLFGRKALVTGAFGCLGMEISKRLAELGVNLIMVDQSATANRSAKKLIEKAYGVDVVLKDCNFENEDDRSALIKALLLENNSLDILINNAAFVGTSNLEGWVAPFETQSIDTWRRAFEVNLTTPFHLTQGLVGLLRSGTSPSIINIGSIYAEWAPDWSMYNGTSMGNPAAYGCSKAGLLQLTRWLATSLSSDQIRVNAVSPGGVFRNQSPIFVKRYEAKTPLGRMAHEDDVCGAIIYLAGDLSKYVTGQTINVDGGWGIW